MNEHERLAPAPADRYSVCQNSIRTGSLSGDAAVAAGSGASALGVLGQEVQLLGPSAVREVLDDAGLGVSSVIALPGWSMDGGTDDLRTISEVLEAAVQLGDPGVLFVSGPALGLSLGAAETALLHRLERLAPLAHEAGATLMLEPVHPIYHSISFVFTLGHALEIARRFDFVKVVFDTAHLWWDHQMMDDLRTAGSMIGTVQVADVSKAALDQQQYGRVQLGEGVVPLEPILRGVVATGYGGYFENEVICRVPREERVEFFKRGREVLAEATGRGWSGP